MSFFSKLNWHIFLPTLFIFSLGLLTLQSVAPHFFLSQFFFGTVGLILFFVISRIDFQVYKNFSVWFWVLSFVFVVLTYMIGLVVRGSARWLDFGFIRLQPSEIIKPLMILFLANFLSSQAKFFKILIISFFYFLPVILILIQPDLGSTLVFSFVWLVLIFIVGVRSAIFIHILSSFFLVAILSKMLKDYQKQRIISFLNPEFDPLGAGYNALQAALAVGSGGILGRGLGLGTQSHLQFLPEFHTDFIFASFAEEWGFLGSTVLLFLYFYLFLYLFIKIKQCDDQFGKLILLGIISILFIQMFINIGMNIGLVPITGITLPLVSYGGSSLISTFILLGIASNICQRKEKEKMLLIS